MTARVLSTPRGPLLAVLVVGGIAARLGLQAALSGRIDGRAMDSGNYLRLAHNLAAHGKFRLVEGVPSAFVAPGYPLVLAVMERLFGDPMWPARWLQALAGGLTVVPLFLLGERIHSRRVAILASLGWVLHPELCGTSLYLYPETLFLALFVVFLLLLHRGWSGGVRCGVNCNRGGPALGWPWMPAGVAGVTLALATLIRPVTLLLPLFLLGLALLRKGRRVTLPWVLVLMGTVVLVILPWSLRNYRHFGRVIPVAGGGGASLWEGMNLPFDGRFHYEETTEAMTRLVGDLPPEQWDPILTRAALDSMKQHPAESLWLAVRKVGRYLFEVYGDVPRGTRRGSVAFIHWPLAIIHWSLLLFALIGVIYDRRAGWRCGILYGVVVYFMGLHAFMLAIPRYRLPILPVLLILAAAGVVELVDSLKRASRGASGSRESTEAVHPVAAPMDAADGRREAPG